MNTINMEPIMRNLLEDYIEVELNRFIYWIENISKEEFIDNFDYEIFKVYHNMNRSILINIVDIEDLDSIDIALYLQYRLDDIYSNLDNIDPSEVYSNNDIIIRVFDPLINTINDIIHGKPIMTLIRKE